MFKNNSSHPIKHEQWVYEVNKINHDTSSSPNECLLLRPGRWGNLDDCEAFVETRINFVNRCILLNKAAFASSSCSNLDCSLTWPSSSFTYHNKGIVKVKMWFISLFPLWDKISSYDSRTIYINSINLIPSDYSETWKWRIKTIIVLYLNMRYKGEEKRTISSWHQVSPLGSLLVPRICHTHYLMFLNWNPIQISLS